MKISQLMFSAMFASSALPVLAQRVQLDMGRLGPAEGAKPVVTTLRPFNRINFRADVDTKPLAIVQIVSSRFALHEDPANVNSSPVQIQDAVVVDSTSMAKGASVTLIDRLRNGARPQLLLSGRKYLVYLAPSERVPAADSLSLVPAAVAPPQFGLEMAEPTSSGRLPTQGSGGEILVGALTDALQNATGRDALEIGAVIGSQLPGTEAPPSWPTSPAPLKGPALRIAQIAESTTDPYVRLAARTILADCSVAGSMDQYMEALADVAKVAPPDFQGAELAVVKGQASDPFFANPFATMPLDRSAYIKSAVKTKNPGFQDLMLRNVGPGQLSNEQVRTLATQLTLPFPPQMTGLAWQGHLKTVCLALDRNSGADPRLTAPPSAYDPNTQTYSLRKAVGYWLEKASTTSH
jgi:hypothetical protein